METKPIKYVIELSQTDLNCLEGELFTLGVWQTEDRLKKGVTEKEFPLLSELLKQVQKFRRESEV